VILTKKGLPDLAITPLKLSVQKDPANGSYAYHLGLALSKVGDKAGAREALEHAVKVGKQDAPDTIEAKKLLTQIS
jgi:Flp pilus assembly protein TadD